MVIQEDLWMSALKNPLQFKMSPMMSSGVQVNLLSGLHRNRREDRPNMGCRGALS